MQQRLLKGSDALFAELSRHPLAFELTGRLNGMTLEFLVATSRLEKACWHKREFRSLRTFAENQARLVEQQLETQRQEQALAQRNAELTALQAEQQELVNLVVHNMSSPVQAVRLVLDLLDRDAETLSPSQRDEHHRIADESLDYLQDVLAQLRWIYDSDDVGWSVAETIELTPFLEAIVFEHQGLARDKDQTVNLHSDSTALIDANPLAVHQIVSNLLSNAIKFSPRGTTVDVELVVSEDASNVRMTVRDEGPGVRASERKNLFTRYGRLSAQPTNGEASTGLGLYVAQRLANNMNGEVLWQANASRTGSAFTLLLPLHSVDDDAPAVCPR